MGQIAVLAVVCGVIGLAAEVFLEHFLVRELDSQLHPVVKRIRHGPPDGAPAPPRKPRNALDFLQLPGIPARTLGAELEHGHVRRAAVLGRSIGKQQPIAAEDRAVLARIPADGRAHNVRVGDLGQYRLRAVHARYGNTLVVGSPLATVEATVTNLALLFTVVAFVGLLIATAAGRVIIRHTLRPLARVAETAREVSATRLDRGDVELVARVPEGDERTEVGQVGAALNRMLAHVSSALSARHASETRMRRFLADASHELRTPLASIRGYAELSRRGGDEVPDESAYAMRRVESEAARMTTLVEDLLLLARLDSGRVLRSEPVDLTRLVVDAVNDARIAAPEHRWHLSLPEGPLPVPGDQQRLHQVAANLLSNAARHTPEDTTVTTGLAEHDGEAVLSVRDNGPGIPAELLPEVFERFARGDGSRSRAAGSTGLGLAIVDAVTAAHGGAVDVRSQAGDTEFTVRLPGACAPGE